MNLKGHGVHVHANGRVENGQVADVKLLPKSVLSRKNVHRLEGSPQLKTAKDKPQVASGKLRQEPQPQCGSGSGETHTFSVLGCC